MAAGKRTTSSVHVWHNKFFNVSVVYVQSLAYFSMVPMQFIFYVVVSEIFNVNHQPTPHRYGSQFDGDILSSSSMHSSGERE
jgi:hypothetical protein